MGEEQAVKSLLRHSEVAKMRLQVREAHFLEMIVVFALLNSLGKDRAYPCLPISCPSPTPTPKSHSNEYSTPHSKALVFHASLNLWVESTGESQGSAVPLSSVAFRFLRQFLNWPCLRCVTTYTAQHTQALRLL